jgi:hypothetical protein
LVTQSFVGASQIGEVGTADKRVNRDLIHGLLKLCNFITPTFILSRKLSKKLSSRFQGCLGCVKTRFETSGNLSLLLEEIVELILLAGEDLQLLCAFVDTFLRLVQLLGQFI